MVAESDPQEGIEELGAGEADALLTQWESLQDDIREYKNQYHRRIVRGTVVLAAVAGYAVQAPARWLLLFIPVIVGLIVIVHVQEANNVYYRSWQCLRIEDRLPVERFDWTRDFSGRPPPDSLASSVGDDRRLGAWWYQAPAAAAYLIGAAVYAGFAFYSVAVVARFHVPEAYRTILGVPGWTWLSALYVVLTAILGVVVVTHLRIRRDVAEARPR